MAEGPETPGDRLYLIRLALGDGKRVPMPMKDFVARVKRLAKATYHANAISLLERGEQEWRLRDFEALAKADPRQRGAPWLAFGIAASEAPEGEATASGAAPYWGEEPGTFAAEEETPATKHAAGSKKRR